MTEIIDAVSARIEDFVDSLNSNDLSIKIKNWGFAELVMRESRKTSDPSSTSSQPIPITGTGRDRKQIALDDKYDFIFWIRLNSPVQQIVSDEDSWGLKEGKRNVLSLRIVVAHKVKLGENLIYRVAGVLPPNLKITGYDLVFLNRDGNIDVDHPTIYETELGKTVYEKHIFDWNLYVLNLNVEYILCKEDYAYGV